MPTARVGKIDFYYETFGKGTPLLMIMGLKFSLLDSLDFLRESIFGMSF